MSKEQIKIQPAVNYIKSVLKKNDGQIPKILKYLGFRAQKKDITNF
jgi:hypothetical protein